MAGGDDGIAGPHAARVRVDLDRRDRPFRSAITSPGSRALADLDELEHRRSEPLDLEHRPVDAADAAGGHAQSRSSGNAQLVDRPVGERRQRVVHRRVAAAADHSAAARRVDLELRVVAELRPRRVRQAVEQLRVARQLSELEHGLARARGAARRTRLRCAAEPRLARAAGGGSATARGLARGSPLALHPCLMGELMRACLGLRDDALALRRRPRTGGGRLRPPSPRGARAGAARGSCREHRPQEAAGLETVGERRAEPPSSGARARPTSAASAHARRTSAGSGASTTSTPTSA